MTNNVYGPKRVVTVSIPSYAAKYGFRTGVTSAQSTAFGHANLESAGESLVIFGSQSPKPPRGRLITGENSIGVTSFVDESKYGDVAIRMTSRGRGAPSPANRTKSIRVFVKFHTVNYVWDMPKFLHTKISEDLAGLGIAPLAAATTNAVQGLDNAMKGGAATGKPLRAQKIDGTSIVGTFIETPAPESLPDGWSIVGGNSLI